MGSLGLVEACKPVTSWISTASMEGALQCLHTTISYAWGWLPCANILMQDSSERHLSVAANLLERRSESNCAAT